MGASEGFARGAAGDVHVFHNAKGVSIQSIWARVEYPALTDNTWVNRIIYHILMEDGTVRVTQ
jgi:hypothetical protein